MQRTTSPLVVVVAHVVLALASATAHARNDVVLSGLTAPDDNGVQAPKAEDFRRFTTELGLALMPSTLTPAETTGQAGFEVGLEYGLHQIADADYWAQGTDNARLGLDPGPVLQTLGLRAKKGFVLPVPLTSEIDASAVWLPTSHVLNVGADARIALNEGFFWIPDLAAQIGVHRLIGSDELDLITGSIGGTLSKSFGVLGSFNLCPFVGYQRIFIRSASHNVRLDGTSPGDPGADVVFQPIELFDNQQNRFSGGVRIVYAVIALYAGMDVDLVEDSDGSRRVLLHGATRLALRF